jgi:hypothetical protein
MKGQRELALFLSLAVFLGSPYVPDRVLKATVNTYVGVAALLLVVLYAVRQDMMVALAVFLAAGALFLENRKRLIAGGSGPGPNGQKEGPIVSEPASVASLSEPAPDLQEGEVHPEFERPERDTHEFEPTEDTGSNDFRAVGHSINEKQPLATMPANSSDAAAEFMERRGLV